MEQYTEPFKPCKGCEYWTHLDGWRGRCGNHGYVCGGDATCDQWRVRHGEWIPASLAMPDPLETVSVIEAKVEDGIVYTRHRIMYFSNVSFLDPYSPDGVDDDGFEVVVWMRHPADPESHHIREELRKL